MIFKDTKRETITRYIDDKQHHHIEYILQDHQFLFVMFNRNIQ